MIQMAEGLCAVFHLPKKVARGSEMRQRGPPSRAGGGSLTSRTAAGGPKGTFCSRISVQIGVPFWPFRGDP